MRTWTLRLADRGAALIMVVVVLDWAWWIWKGEDYGGPS